MFRVDAFISQYLVHPIRKRFPSPQRRVPILMYHSISNASEYGHPYYRTATTPKVFADHMKYLAENGYTTVSISEAVKWVEGTDLACSQPVVITFDDGYRNFHTEAFPVLSRYGFRATVYLPTAYVGKTFKDIECLTWGEVRELQAAGMEFGSHTVTHRQLRGLPMEDLRTELWHSKETIEQKLGTSVASFAYPYAFPEMDREFTNVLRRLLKGAGYQNGVSTIIGTADRRDEKLFVRRLPVNSFDDHDLFEIKLQGSYDWLHKIQRGYKIIRVKKHPTRQAA